MKSDSTSAITRDVDYGYSVTSQSSQEQTADRVLVHESTWHREKRAVGPMTPEPDKASRTTRREDGSAG
jgi:hypothetical protein